jgi:4-aminobutyrate aminotransferase-like enzyme
MHFSRQSVMEESGVPIIVRGEGHHIWDSKGKKYLDGLSGLFVVRPATAAELAEAAAKQAEELAFFPLWSYAHPAAIELADRLAGYAPGDLNRVFFTTGGGEAVETAWKLAKQYFKLIGQPDQVQGDLRASRLPRHPAGRAGDHRHPGIKEMFEPLHARRLPGAEHQLLPRPVRSHDDLEAVRPVGRDRIERG